MSRKAFVAISASLVFLAAGASLAAAETVTGTYSNDADVTNQATGFPNGPFSLTSTLSTVSYVDFTPSQTFTYSQIQSIGATFTDLSGGAYGGSPRLAVVLNTSDYILTFLGTPPSFTDSDISAFSGANLNNSNNNSAYENNNTYQTFASFDALYGADTVTNVYFILDGGWGGNGPQALTLNSINIEIPGSATPIPAALPLFATGLGALGALSWRRKRKAQAAA